MNIFVYEEALKSSQKKNPSLKAKKKIIVDSLRKVLKYPPP